MQHRNLKRQLKVIREKVDYTELPQRTEMFVFSDGEEIPEFPDDGTIRIIIQGVKPDYKPEKTKPTLQPGEEILKKRPI